MAASLVHLPSSSASSASSRHDESFMDLVLDYDDPDLHEDRSKSSSTSADSEVGSFSMAELDASPLSIASAPRSKQSPSDPQRASKQDQEDEDGFTLKDFEAMESELIQSFPPRTSFRVEDSLVPLQSNSSPPSHDSSHHTKSSSSHSSDLDARFLPFDPIALEQVLQMENAHQVLEQVLSTANDPNFEPLPAPEQLLVKVPKRQSSTARNNNNNKSCDRCKSDLNRNLLVACCCCSFRRHLYCFVPPLAQYPGISGNTLTRRPWRCDSCAMRSQKEADAVCDQDVNNQCQQAMGPQSTGSDRSALKSSVAVRARPKSTKSLSLERQLHQRHLAALLVVKNASAKQFSVPIAQQNNSSASKQRPTQDRPDSDLMERARQVQQRQADHVFDWKEFRAQKLTKMVQHKQQNLVFYSETEALMRKTAMFWQWYTESRNKRRHAKAKALLKRKPPDPSRFSLMHVMTPEDLIKLDRTLMRKEDENACARQLYDDGFYNVRRKTLIAVEAMRLAMIRAARAKAAAEAAERERIRFHSEINQMLLEDPPLQSGLMHLERDLMHNEDTWKEIERILLGFYMAAKLIQTSFRQHRVARQQLQVNRKRHARQRLMLWKLHVIVRVRLLRVRQKLKVLALEQKLLANLQQTMEIHKQSDQIIDQVEKRRFVASRRVQKFFLGRVRRFCRLKKKMLAVRIQLWWRRFANDRKWRALAKAYRHWVRDTAARTIQHFYRKLLVQRKFQLILEKHALRVLQTRLRRWLMARAIKKEKRRRALLQQSTVLASQMSSSEWQFATFADDDMQVKDILHDLGMGFYANGDFWNAAVFLERSKSVGRVLNVEDLIVLGYCHSMNWHRAYDKYILLQARDCYALALELAPEISKEGVIVLEMATVLMHLQEFKLSLRLLGKLIELFISEGGDFLCNCLLLAAIQLKQIGELATSLEYLTFLTDQAPVAEYCESDLLVLCAITSEAAKDETRANDAWKAAVRLWKLHKKEERVQNGFTTKDADAWARESSKSQHVLMVTELARRAKQQGHYLLTTHLLTYALNNAAREDVEGNFTKWMDMADVMRHLDNQLLCKRSLHNAKELKPEDAGVLEALEQWTGPVEDFRVELKRVRDLERVEQIVTRNTQELACQQELYQQQLAQQLAEQQAQQAAEDATWSYETPVQDYWDQQPSGDDSLETREQPFDQQDQQWTLEEFNAEAFEVEGALHATEDIIPSSSWT